MAFQNSEKKPRYSHSPTQLEHNGVKVEIKEDGKITLTQDHDDGSYDEISTSADLILRLSSIIRATRKTSWVDR